MKIYTKTGDDGTTALFDGTRVNKDNPRVVLYGEIDELNSTIGVAISFLKHEVLMKRLLQVQKDLFALGARLANPKDKKQKTKSDFDEKKISWLEKEIDEMQGDLPPMTGFILPGGTHVASLLHVSRTICRRIERCLVSTKQKENLNDVELKYINRLSDYLFVAARHANYLEGQKDIPWE